MGKLVSCLLIGRRLSQNSVFWFCLTGIEFAIYFKVNEIYNVEYFGAIMTSSYL